MYNGGSINNLPFLLVRQQEYKDVLLFTSPPMFATTILTGNVVATLYVTSSLEHTDFVVRLLDFDSRKNL
jgi:predicted acyl esterase